MKDTMVVSNYLQEVAMMNSPILEHIAGEKNADIMHSIELFIGMAFAISVVGLLFLAAV